MSNRIPVNISAEERVEISETQPIRGPIIANPRRIIRLLIDKTVARVEDEQF
jgi:hypothetical protein